MLLVFFTSVTAVCLKGESSFFTVFTPVAQLPAAYTDTIYPHSSRGAQQNSLSSASAASSSAMPVVLLSGQEDDERDTFVAPPHWVS